MEENSLPKNAGKIPPADGSDNNKFLIEYYKHALDRRTEQLDYIWETVKFSTSIITAVLTATIALWKFVEIKEVAFMPVFCMILSIWTFINIKRQYRRFLEVTSWINKIERYLGFHFIVENNDRFFKEDEYLMPPRWAKSSSDFKKSED